MKEWRIGDDALFVTARLNLCRWTRIRRGDKLRAGIDGGQIQMDLSLADAEAESREQRALPAHAQL